MAGKYPEAVIKGNRTGGDKPFYGISFGVGGQFIIGGDATFKFGLQAK
jgi:hypothetical protein